MRGRSCRESTLRFCLALAGRLCLWLGGRWRRRTRWGWLEYDGKGDPAGGVGWLEMKKWGEEEMRRCGGEGVERRLESNVDQTRLRRLSKRGEGRVA